MVLRANDLEPCCARDLTRGLMLARQGLQPFELFLQMPAVIQWQNWGPNPDGLVCTIGPQPASLLRSAL